ncbi:MAG: PH domain-containing protein [bacterium]|nr:PH domain-containing protein [bacterium]
MKRLDPRAVWLFFFQNYGILVILALVFLVYTFIDSGASAVKVAGNSVDLGTDFLNLTRAVIVIAALCAYSWAWLTYYFYHYEMSGDALKIERGIILKKIVLIPYRQIQNINIDRGMWELFLGLSRLRIETAGFSQAPTATPQPEGLLPGLLPATAEALQKELLGQARYKIVNDTPKLNA